MVYKNNKSFFVRPQIIKLRNLGKTYSEIVSMINCVNGDQYQTSETVKDMNGKKINIFLLS